MTKEEAFALGKATAYVETITGAKHPINNGAFRPMSTMAQAIQRALAEHALTDEDHNIIEEIVNVIEIEHVKGTSGSEIVQPLPIQGHWQLGYIAGKQLAYEIMQRRKKYEKDSQL